MTVMTRRTPPAGKAPSKAAKPVSSGYRGSAGLQKMREEQASQEARKEAVQMNMNMPFRFFCEAGEHPKKSSSSITASKRSSGALSTT